MQINLKLDCTLYSGLGVHFHRNTHLVTCLNLLMKLHPIYSLCIILLIFWSDTPILMIQMQGSGIVLHWLNSLISRIRITFCIKGG